MTMKVCFCVLVLVAALFAAAEAGQLADEQAFMDCLQEPSNCTQLLLPRVNLTEPLTGSIPSEIGQLTSLVVLDLSGNALNGSIPSEIWQLTTLLALQLQSNQLTGSIPSEIGQLAALLVLQFNANFLSGSIPSEIGQLTSLVFLEISQNALVSTIPSQLKALTSLVILSAHNNQLAGKIPSELAALPILGVLGMFNNKLTGMIPSELAALTALQTLALSTNSLTSTVPLELAALTDLLEDEDLASRGGFVIRNNRLCGPLPETAFWQAQGPLPACTSPPASPPPPSPSPPPAANKIEEGRAYVKVLAQAVLSGTLSEWLARAKQAAFEGACAKSFGVQCIFDGVKAGSVVVDFTLVQYRDTDKGRFVGDLLADPAITAAFKAAVLAATGSTVESAPTIVSVTEVSASGVVGFSAAFSAGAIAGLVIMCVVVVTALIVGGVYAYRKSRQNKSNVGDTATA